MSVDNKQFMGYARVASGIRHVRAVPELSSLVNMQREGEDPGFAFKVSWRSKQRVSFDLIRFIRNSHNSNNSVNMCKEFNVGLSGSRRVCSAPAARNSRQS